jgi:flavin reductase (DIM6/NTAB) family NADH-FMN oxidoreductase RutF
MDQSDVLDHMRLGLRRFAKAVMVVSARHEGVRYAMSATACSEVSLDPPTMLVCVNQSAAMHIPLAAGANFAINMLHSGQEQISRNCAGAKRGEDRFGEGDWQDDDGTPWLADGQASFICRVVNRVDHGTHSVFIGEVRAAHSAEIVDPLVYVDGVYLEPAVDGRYLKPAQSAG